MKMIDNYVFVVFDEWHLSKYSFWIFLFKAYSIVCPAVKGRWIIFAVSFGVFDSSSQNKQNSESWIYCGRPTKDSVCLKSLKKKIGNLFQSAKGRKLRPARWIQMETILTK